MLELRVAVATLAALPAARDALASFERIALPPSPADAALAALAALLRQVLATRESLAEKPAPEGFEQQPQQSWLRGDGALPFFKRQQFKTLSDLAVQTPDALSPPWTCAR